MRMFCAMLVHETSDYSPIPTNLGNFRQALLHRPSAGETVEGFQDETGLIAKARARGHEVVVGTCAMATPSARLVRNDYELLRDEIVADIKRAGPLDAIALFLHGAQMAHDYDDCEGDLLRAIRAAIGPDVPVGAVIDLHGNMTEAMARDATAIIACKEYPHTDFAARAEELLDVLEAAAARKSKPVMAWRAIPMLGIFHTTRQPMRGFVDRVTALEKEPGILSISIVHGFPWADTPHTGSAILVVADGDRAAGQAMADRLAEEFFSMREKIAVPGIGIEEAVARARAASGLTIIADTADNAGGGAASDATFFLRHLIENRVEGAALGMIWDPIAVEFAFAAGVGATVPLRIGGKCGPLSGAPVDGLATITGLNPAHWQRAFGIKRDMGRSAAIRIGGVDVILASTREQVHSPECFTGLGVALEGRRILVVKSAQHFHAEFAALAQEIIYAVGPGTTSVEFKNFEYTKLRRPIWPLDPGARLRVAG